MQLRKIVLGLAAMTMLASCAKEVTKAEAIKIAKENYDASNQVYKSAHFKSVTTVKYSDNVPEEDRMLQDKTSEGDITDREEMDWYRLRSKDIEMFDEKNVTFKADGAKLEISQTTTSDDKLGSTTTMFQSVKCDEIGYVLEEVGEVKVTTLISSGVTYEYVLKNVMTLTWTK